MELVLGTDVREHGHRAGRLAGFEVECASRRIRKVILSGDGELGNHAVTRPFSGVQIESGTIEIRPFAPSDSATDGAVLLSHATRIIRSGREVGRLSGVQVAPDGALQAVIGRKNWWTRRFTLDAASIDLSIPGEIRTSTTATRAA